MAEQNIEGRQELERIYIEADSEDPIDKLLVRHAYEQGINRVQYGSLLPTEAEQREMLSKIRLREPDAIKTVINGNLAMIGAVAYGYRGSGLDSDALVWTAANALQHTAARFDFSRYREFSDTAIRSMRRAIDRRLGIEPGPQNENPTREVERFLGSLVIRPPENRIQPPSAKPEKPVKPEPRPKADPKPAAQEAGPVIPPEADTAYKYNEFEGIHFTELTAEEQLVLFKVAQSQVEIAKNTGMSITKVGENVKSIKEKLKCGSTLEVIFKAHYQGAFLECRESRQPLPESLPQDVITVLESSMTYTELAEKTGATPEYFSSRVNKAMRKTGARSRVELTLMLLDARRMRPQGL